MLLAWTWATTAQGEVDKNELIWVIFKRWNRYAEFWSCEWPDLINEQCMGAICEWAGQGHAHRCPNIPFQLPLYGHMTSEHNLGGTSLPWFSDAWHGHFSSLSSIFVGSYLRKEEDW